MAFIGLHQRSDKYLRFTHGWRWPERVAALVALVTLITDIGWARDIGLPESVTLIIEAVLAVVLLAKVPVAFSVPIPDDGLVPTVVASSRRAGSRGRSGRIKRFAAGLSLRFRLKKRVPRVFEPFRRVFVRCPGEGVALLLAIVGFALMPLAKDPAAEVAMGVRLTLAAAGGIFLVNLLRNFQRLKIPPLLLFTGTYLVLILLGSLLLSSPRSSVADGGLSFVDAIFTAASASCVTGLSVIDIGTELTVTGQVILMILIQIGGLGIMTFAAFASIMVGAGMSIRDRRAISEVLNYDVVGKVGRLVLWILGITITIEVLGAVIMHGHWMAPDGTPLSEGKQVYWSVFHAISGFCNAGFSLDGASLMNYGGSREFGVNYHIMGTISGLAILGGLGFTVIMELATFRFWQLPFVRRMKWVGKFTKRNPVPRLSLQTKIVLVATAILLVGGSFMFWLLESGTLMGSGVLQGRPVDEQVINAFYHGGVGPRSVGFNSLECGDFRPETQFMTILLMLIGAAPGSTGGGLKVTAVAILLIVLWSSLRGRPPEIFRRRISDDQVRRVLLALVTGLIVLNLAVFLLLMTEGHWLRDVPNGFEDLTFEVVSAFATTGLSTGISADFTDAGKLILSICMFLGRVGPMTLVLALGRKQAARYEYPGESVMLG